MSRCHSHQLTCQLREIAIASIASASRTQAEVTASATGARRLTHRRA